MLPWVFQAQLRRPWKGYCPQIVKQDLDDFNIKLNFNEVRGIKENIFKKMVADACKEYSFDKLLKLKGNDKSKGKNLQYNKLDM